MEVLIKVGTAIVGKLTEYTVDSVRYLFPYTSQVRNLRGRIQELRNKEKELQGRVDAATSLGEEIEGKAETWLSGAGSLSQQAEEFLNNECQANDRCFGGSVPNLVSRHRLSKRAKKLAEKLGSQIEAAGLIDRVSVPAALQKPVEIVGDYRPFESRKKILEDIMDALRDPEVIKVGVYGMGGIGKTMLAKEVARQATKEKLFSEVVITTISQAPNVHSIQQDIADKLHLKSFGEVQSRHERAHRLQSHLKEEKKKILIILDDIWGRLDLIEVVGIDFEHDPLGCKILLTSRSLDCVQSDMGAEKNIPVDVLAPDEGKNLFYQIVGDKKLVEQPDFGPLADDIIGECGELPLAITTVAYALKHKGLSVWKDALGQLRNSTFRNIKGMSDYVYKSIRLSYDFLESEEEKSFLLLCSLYEEDESISIEELRRYCVGWGLLPHFGTLEDARTRVDSLVERLKALCLLSDGQYYGTVKMHDIIRDVAILIASEDKHGMRSIMFDELEDPMKQRELRNSKAISLLRCDNTARPHPERLECPQLELLLFMPIKTNFYSQYNLNHLFVQGKELKTLSWKRANIRSIWSSSSTLENLQTLCLRSCEFEDIDLIGDLKNLRILDLSHSSVKQLTRKLGQLTRLQLLDLRGCRNLEVIEPNVISNLTRLEELYMAEGFQGWEVEEEGINERRNAGLMELKNLQHLTVLYITVVNANILPRELFSKRILVGYRIFIGAAFPLVADVDGISRSLSIHFNQWSQLIIESGLELLMKSSEKLSLGGLNMGIHNVVRDLDRDGFPDLKHLHFNNTDGVQFIVCSVDQIQPCHAFPSLETLWLYKLTNLERICHGKLTADSFNKLREVYVSNCHKLKNLFSLSAIKRLHAITVEECEMMEEIISHGRENHEANSHEVEVFELRKLTLSSLPKFVEFCCWSEMEATCGSSSSIDSDSPKPIFSQKVSFPNLETLHVKQMNVEKIWPKEVLINSSMQNLIELTVEGCDSVQYLFSFVMAEIQFIVCSVDQIQPCNAFPRLETIQLYELTNLERICHGKLTADSFNKLREVDVSNCHKLKNLFPLSVVKRLHKIRVEKCEMMEEIVSHGRENHEAYSHEVEVFELRELTLSSLPKVVEFCCWSEMEATCRSSSSIDSDSPKPIFSQKIQPCHAFPSLETLWLYKLTNLERICHGKLTADSFNKLREVYVSNCHKLKNLFSLSAIKRLHAIRVEECEMMEEIISHGRENHEAYSHEVEVFELRELTLSSLPKFVEFCCWSEMEATCGSSSSIDSDSPKPIFSQKVSFPKLEKLHVGQMNVEKIWPKELLINSSMQQPPMCARLYDLHMLRHLFVDPSNTVALPTLRTLDVQRCGRLQSFAPSCMSFHNLETLEVSECHGLTYLLASSTATSLVHLKNMKVAKCKRMKEIINNNEEEDEFVFRSLEILVLRDLPNLKSFYSGNNAISFPSLEKLYVNRCPEMRTFSLGIISTSSLLNTIITEIEGKWVWESSISYFRLNARAVRELWDINVNTTIRKLWEEDDPNSGLVQLFAHEMDV